MAGAMMSERMSEPSISMSPSPSQLMERTPSKRVSNASVSDTSSSFADSHDRSPSNSRQLDVQDQTYLRSEEYRQMFRLPPEEVLVQDFNCALQENFLLQGHMYLFANYICFYSNLFGFETKKIISFHEISSVRRAKAAVLFPTAIEIIAGGKKYFFTSFLSRDEAFKIINDGWLQQGNVAKLITDQQDLKPLENGQENGSVIVEEAVSSSQGGEGLDLLERRNEDSCTLDDLKGPVDGEIDMLSTSDGPEENVPEDSEIVQATGGSLRGKSLVWVEEESDAPEVPECYTNVAESKFLVNVEDFFQYLFSDNTVDFLDDFHRKCGDKEFSCSKWSSHDKLGHTRDVSFQHPIKLYFGAKFGCCSELQRYRVYRNSHLVVDTSQEITGVPFADYFRVEGLWHVEKGGNDSIPGCTLRVYTNVNFSKSTMFKGKIVQSTIDECRDAYAAWIELAHEVLKQKNLEIQETGAVLNSNMIRNNIISLEEPIQTVEHLNASKESIISNVRQHLSTPEEDVNQLRRIDSVRESCNAATLVAYTWRDSVIRFLSKFKSQNNISILLIITLTLVLLIMQISILVLLSRPQQVHLISQPGFTGINGGGGGGRGEGGGFIERRAEFNFIEKQIKHLKQELHFVETMLDNMQNQHALLKLKLEDLELFTKRQR